MTQYKTIATLKGPRGRDGKRGIPGALAVPTSEAVAEYFDAGLEDLDSLIAGALARLTEVVFTPQMFGAVGDGIADDTQAVQDAIDAALAVTDPINVEKPVFHQARNGAVFFPMGTYLVDEIDVAGTISVWGVGGAIYAASVLMQRSAGQSILRLKGDTDSVGSQATYIRHLTFKSASGTSSPDVAQIITDTNINSHSVYIRNCWFKTPERYAIWIKQGDDLQIESCTFDVSAFGFLRLGSTTGTVTNGKLDGSTFFEPSTNCIELENVTGFTIDDSNRAYNSPSAWYVSVPPSGAVKVEGVRIGGILNDIHGGVVLSTVSKAVTIDITARNVSHGLLAFTGGGIIYGLDARFTCMNVDAAMGFGQGSAVSGAGCGLQFSTIDLRILGGAASSTARVLDLPDARVIDNDLSRIHAAHFAAIHNLANPAANGF